MPDALHFTGNAEADRLLAAEPLALLIGFVLDQQVTVPTAFAGPLKLQQRLGGLDAAAIAATDPDRLVEVVPREAGDPPLPRQHGEAGAGALRRRRRGVRRRRRRASGAMRPTRPISKRRIEALPGFGEMKVKALASVLARRYGNAMAEPLVPDHPMLGDVDSPEALVEYQAAKRAYKASLRAAAGLIELRLYRDGGQTAVDVAQRGGRVPRRRTHEPRARALRHPAPRRGGRDRQGSARRRAGARRHRPARLQRRPPRPDPGAAAAGDRARAPRGAADRDARRSRACPT